MPHQSLDEIRARFTGPVMSVPTTFTRDGELDWDGIARMIEMALHGDTQVVLLTAGDSQYFFLNDDEVAQLTRFTIDRVAGRALTVAATGRWSTRQATDFAARCCEWGADVLMSLTPEQASDPRGLTAHYRSLAAVMPVMLVGFPPFALLESLQDVPAICCFKEDGTLEYAVDLLQRYAERFVVMTGGTLMRHLAEWPFGCRAFMDWSTCFAPWVGMSYWRALQRGDVSAALRIVNDIEKPLFLLAEHCTGGWQSLWRTALAANGIAQRFLRLPQLFVPDDEFEQLVARLAELGLVKNLLQ